MLANAIFPATASVSQHFPGSAPAASSGPWKWKLKWKWSCETCVGTTVAHLHSAFSILHSAVNKNGPLIYGLHLRFTFTFGLPVDSKGYAADSADILTNERISFWLSLVNHSSQTMIPSRCPFNYTATVKNMPSGIWGKLYWQRSSIMSICVIPSASILNIYFSLLLLSCVYFLTNNAGG